MNSTGISQPSNFDNSVAVMTPNFLTALNFAAYKHRNQRRKGADKTPYINHPIAVANILLNEAGITDEVVLIAAILHDTVEDTETSFEEIEQQFGNQVSSVVAEVTDDKALPKAERKQAQIEHAAKLSDRACWLKFADKTANVRDIHMAPPDGWDDRRINEYLEWGKRVVDNLRGRHERLETLFNQAYQQAKSTRRQLK